MAKKKRKLTAYNRFVAKKVRGGSTFKQAARSWKGGRTTTRASPRKRKQYKAKRRINYGMAKRKRASKKRTTGFRLPGIGNIGAMLKAVGLGFAVGAGTVTAINYIGDMSRIPQIKQVAPIAGAYAAWATSPGIPGIVAAIPLIQQSGLLQGATQQAQGQGAFV